MKWQSIYKTNSHMSMWVRHEWTSTKWTMQHIEDNIDASKYLQVFFNCFARCCELNLKGE